MRINQSPNWRALAVLGALLSVIIVWPTVLSMPMLEARISTAAPASITTEANHHQPTPLLDALSNFTSNVTTTTITVAPTNENIIASDSFYSEREQIANYSDYSDYGNLLQLNVSTSDSEDQDGDQDIDVDEHLTHDRGDIDPLYAIMTSFDDGNVSKSRRVKKSNMVYNKRKRKKINQVRVSAQDDVSNTTYLSSASISEDNNNNIINSLSNNNNISNSVSVSDVNSSDKVTAASIISHQYPSKRTRNSIKSDRSESTNNDGDDDNDDGVVDDIDIMSTTTTMTPSRGWLYYLSTTPSDDSDVTSEFWNFEDTSIHDNNDTFVTSTATTSPSAITPTTTISIITSTTQRTLTHTEYPVLSRTDRSVHTKRGIPDRQRGSIGEHASAAVDGGDRGGGSIKSRRLKNHNKNHNYRNNNHTNSNSSNLDRNERSTISHISGPGRKIQLYIKNRFIQLMPDGTVNGTQDDLSDYTILQRTTVDVGRIKIQGVATCLYLCMDQCGAVYGSKEFTDDCVFNESMEQHNYNTYSSTYNSNSRRIYYLALNRHGEPRKLQIPPSRSLGKLATYTKAITETVPQDRVETLIAKKFGANRVKHGIRQLCDTGKPLVELTYKILKARSQCTATNSNSNSNSSNSNKNGQLNVPAANDKSRLSDSNSNLTNSTSSSISTNSNSSSSISNSSNGHTSSNSNNNHVIKKKKKKRRCRPGENEDEHNCQRGGPQAIKKRPGNHNKMAKCKDATPETAVECANQKRPKKGGKKGAGGGPKHNGGGNGGAKQNGGRGGKKLNQNGRQQGGNKNSNKKNNGKQPKNGLGGGGRTTPTTVITTTTVHPMLNNKISRIRSAPSTTTTTTTTTAAPVASSTTTETSAVSGQSTFVSSSQVMQSLLNQTSSEVDESDGEDTSAEVETGEAEAEDDEMANEDDDTSSHLPFIGEHTQLVSGSDDFLYDDDLDL